MNEPPSTARTFVRAIFGFVLVALGLTGCTFSGLFLVAMMNGGPGEFSLFNTVFAFLFGFFVNPCSGLIGYGVVVLRRTLRRYPGSVSS